MKKRFWNKPSMIYVIVAGILSAVSGLFFGISMLAISAGIYFFDAPRPDTYELCVLVLVGIGSMALLLAFDRYNNVLPSDFVNQICPKKK